MIKNIFNVDVANEVVARINTLQPNTSAKWGTMNVSQMLAHCNVPFDYTYEPTKFKKPGFLMKFMLKTFVKKLVTSPNPYKHNERTAPNFIITDQRDFALEKGKLIANILKTQELGAAYFEGKENFSFGKMTAEEWNTLHYKHLDHHLNQFGA
ncbi:DUF1569 domain-containing protein [Myroides sp. JBRI-B21084]|uniref:DUF1569 domain-containing protein n=1 Tax=Myroides sp. JBRI-B21084 TaxID=3119977 RepID=UPI00294FFE7E|nr:DUF1569 domain-containing protein [Paenimyroides cloacae]